MIVTVVSFKGGVGKTTTAIHLAQWLNALSPALLVDGDPNRSATALARRGHYGFTVVDERGAVRHARDFQYCVIDTKARPEPEDLASLAASSDVLVIPSSPDALSVDVLLQTVEALQRMPDVSYRVLLTIVPPRPNQDGDRAQRSLLEAGYPVLSTKVQRRQAFHTAALLGVPVSECDGLAGKLGWLDYCAVAKELFDGKI